MPSENLEFSSRAVLSELMDETESYAELSACLRDLVKVNRAVFAYRPTLEWLNQFAGKADKALHIVDVGCGAGDMLRRIASWAHARRVPVRLTGLDRNPMAVRAAQELNGESTAIEWAACEVFDYHPQDSIDLVISSLVTHHLTDEEIVRFLRWMEQNAARGWFINDLHRGRGSYFGFKFLSWAMRWHRFVRHDGPVSIRRSFSEGDWHRYVRESGLSRDSVRIFKAWPGRLCVSRVK